MKWFLWSSKTYTLFNKITNFHHQTRTIHTSEICSHKIKLYLDVETLRSHTKELPKYYRKGLCNLKFWKTRSTSTRKIKENLIALRNTECWRAEADYGGNNINILPYLEPINSTAVDERWKLSQTIAESISNGAERHHNVEIFFAEVHKKSIQGQGTEFFTFISSLSCCTNTNTLRNNT